MFLHHTDRKKFSVTNIELISILEDRLGVGLFHRKMIEKFLPGACRFPLVFTGVHLNKFDNFKFASRYYSNGGADAEILL